jgi:hypothetical protein
MDLFNLYSRKAHKVRKYNDLYKHYVRLRKQYGPNSPYIKDERVLEKLSTQFYMCPDHIKRVINTVIKNGGEYHDEPVYGKRETA